MRVDETSYFVQFPHPGGEHNPSTDEMPWNGKAHRRKFLVSHGRYADSDGRVHEAELVFWGEWEPPSRVVDRWPASGRLPRSLHRPYWMQQATKEFRQNTDPWVFGKRMIYSNCKQVSGPYRRRTSMQGLTRGSVICFGSSIGREFCVDTVFVVASAEPWTPGTVGSLSVGEAFKICTAEPISTKRKDARLSLMLYRGATIDDPIDGMFSFVPARRADAGDPRFCRPAIRVPGAINAASRQSARGSKNPLPAHAVRDVWDAVHRQVLAADLLLAVQFRTPGRERHPVVTPKSGRQRC